MRDGYLGAIADFMAAHAEIEVKVIVDRFHVAKNYWDDFDTLRKAVVLSKVLTTN